MTTPTADFRLNYLEPRNLPAATVASLVGYMAELQEPDGGIVESRTPGAGGVFVAVPYFDNLGLSGLLQVSSSPTLKLEAQRYASWFMLHFGRDRTFHGGADGAIDVYSYDRLGPGARILPNLNQVADADDSAPATFLLMVENLVKAGGTLYGGASAQNESKIQTMAKSMFDLRTPDGLTWATATYPVEYLADNSEVYAGFRAAAWLEEHYFRNMSSAAFYANIAAAVGTAIGTQLWNPATSTFYVDKVNGPNGPPHFDPPSTTVWGSSGVAGQSPAIYELFPALYNVPNPHTADVIGFLDAHFPNWETTGQPGYGQSGPAWDPYPSAQAGVVLTMDYQTASANSYLAWVQRTYFTGSGEPQGYFAPGDAGWLALLVAGRGNAPA